MPPPEKLPAQVRAAHDDWDVRVHHPGDYSTRTWKLTSPAREVRFAKVAWTGLFPSLEMERDRTVWLEGKQPVPRVIDHGKNDEMEWLVTEALGGIDATDDGLRANPATLVPIFALGLRAFHETPSDGCAFDFRNDVAIEHVRRRVAGDGVPIEVEGMHSQHQHLGVEGALARVEATRPPTEDVVVCHGDYCFPNVMISGGRAVGYLDLGEVGLADRWWDIAIGAWSVTWNVDPKWEPLFYEAYGVEPDPERIAYYRLLYDLAC
jgi:kanamycin kinase